MLAYDLQSSNRERKNKTKIKKNANNIINIRRKEEKKNPIKIKLWNVMQHDMDI